MTKTNAVLIVAIAAALGGEGASAGNEGRGCAPVTTTRYRTLPEEAEVARVTMFEYLSRHAPQAATPLCVTMPGYKPFSPKLQEQLAGSSWRLDAATSCRFEGGRVVHGVEGVWRVAPGQYIADVQILEFHDISIALGRFRYAISRKGALLQVQSEAQCQ